MEQIELIFFSPVTIVAVVMALTEYVKRTLKPSARYTQLWSWLFSTIICLAAWLENLGMFDGMSLYLFAFTSILIGLASNGAYDFLLKPDKSQK